jgi:hypothetical protein
LASPGAIARISASTSAFGQIGELFEQGGGHLFTLLRFPRPDAVDLVDPSHHASLHLDRTSRMVARPDEL